jgi:hypothetical protein
MVSNKKLTSTQEAFALLNCLHVPARHWVKKGTSRGRAQKLGLLLGDESEGKPA